MTATTNGDAPNILRHQFPQFNRKPTPPAPRLVAETLPEECTPEVIIGRSIEIIAAEMKRIRAISGEWGLDMAMLQARDLAE